MPLIRAGSPADQQCRLCAGRAAARGGGCRTGPAAAVMDKLVMPVPTREEVRRGIFYMILAVAVFSVVNALVKYEEAVYPVPQVIFFRSIFALLFSCGLVVREGGVSILRTHRLTEHIGRGTLQFVSMICIFIAYHLMPLADAVAVTFSSPLFLTLLSIPLLGEKVGRHRW